jgi:hypothetical protein
MPKLRVSTWLPGNAVSFIYAAQGRQATHKRGSAPEHARALPQGNGTANSRQKLLDGKMSQAQTFTPQNQTVISSFVSSFRTFSTRSKNLHANPARTPPAANWPGGELMSFAIRREGVGRR